MTYSKMKKLSEHDLRTLLAVSEHERNMSKNPMVLSAARARINKISTELAFRAINGQS